MIEEADSKNEPPQAEVSRGVLLVGHGTRNELGTAQFFELATRLSEVVDPVPVEAALLDEVDILPHQVT